MTRNFSLFSILGDSYATVCPPPPHSKGREAFAHPDLAALMSPWILAKRAILVDPVSLPDTGAATSPDVSVSHPFEYTFPIGSRISVGKPDPADWKRCSSPAAGLIAAAAQLAVTRNLDASTFFFHEIGNTGSVPVERGDRQPRSVVRLADGRWEASLGHFAPPRGKQPNRGKYTRGPFKVWLEDLGSAYGYLVYVGGPHFVVFSGRDAPQVGGTDDRAASTLRNFWDDHVLVGEPPLLGGPHGAESVREDMLWRLGSALGDGVALEVERDVSVEVVMVDSAGRRILYKAFDGHLEAPVNSSANGVIAASIAASDLGMLDLDGPVFARSPATYSVESWDAQLESELEVELDQEFGWQIRAACNFVIGGVPCPQ